MALTLFLNTLYAVGANARESVGFEGSGIAGGYDIADQSYTLNENDPSIVESVQFTLHGDYRASVAMVRLDDRGEWYACSLKEQGGMILARCDTTSSSPIYVSELDEFRVIATH